VLHLRCGVKIRIDAAHDFYFLMSTGALGRLRCSRWNNTGPHDASHWEQLWPSECRIGYFSPEKRSAGWQPLIYCRSGSHRPSRTHGYVSQDGSHCS